MQPLSEEKDHVLMCDDTIHVSVVGTVIASSKQNNTFEMYTKQYVCGQNEEIAVHGVMDKNPKWKNPLTVLPRPNSIIAFDSILDRFDSYMPPHRSKPILCAVVSVQDITFLQCVEEQTTSLDKKKMNDRMRSRLRKGKAKDTTSLRTTPEASCTASNPSAVSIALSSQQTLGKRKPSSSEDKIEQATSL